ncbi:autotransporter domain-containing protein, partial [Dialister succinatiphilus]|uniref:autotransporter domain-containing protein n=1 Tax=Dialister succinatiphilus TaxID=487173 RepID=UPI002357D556
AWGNSISLEYGKRFVQDSGFYLDPSVEFTAGRLNGKNFTGTSDLGTLYVHQHGFNSAIGRIGFSIGRQLPKSSLYAKLALAHEFAGDFKTDFYADDGGLKSTKVDLSDTWLDMELGGSLSLGKNVYLYGTYTRTFEADMATKWRADVGVRYTF